MPVILSFDLHLPMGARGRGKSGARHFAVRDKGRVRRSGVSDFDKPPGVLLEIPVTAPHVYF